jgi:hypothetical protein
MRVDIVATLNRFPLLGLWAEEAARRIGYSKDEAESLGHAYAVLYAIRARGKPHLPASAKTEIKHRKPVATERMEFGGDQLDVVHRNGKVRGLVGHAQPQTPESYRASVEHKFPPGDYRRLQKAFRAVFRQFPPKRVDSRLIYDLYDQWKQQCAVGRLVNLDQLLAWCQEHGAAAP